MGENFRELVEKWNFAEKNFVDCSLIPTVSTEPFKQSLRKLSLIRHKTVKFAKVFSLENFRLYGNSLLCNFVDGC